jgi:hypothetical protein
MKPSEAQVGYLYKLRFPWWETELTDPPEYYTYDLNDRVTNKTWTCQGLTFCLLLKQEPNFTAVLVGDDIIHISDEEELTLVSPST